VSFPLLNKHIRQCQGVGQDISEPHQCEYLQSWAERPWADKYVARLMFNLDSIGRVLKGGIYQAVLANWFQLIREVNGVWGQAVPTDGYGSQVS